MPNKSFWQQLLDLLPAPRVPEEKPETSRPIFDGPNRYLEAEKKLNYDDHLDDDDDELRTVRVYAIDVDDDDDCDDEEDFLNRKNYPLTDDEDDGEYYRLTKDGEKVFEGDEDYFGQYEEDLEKEEGEDYPYVDLQTNRRYRLSNDGQEIVYTDDEEYFGEYEVYHEKEVTISDLLVEVTALKEVNQTLEKKLNSVLAQNGVIIQVLDNISLQLLVKDKKGK